MSPVEQAVQLPFLASSWHAYPATLLIVLGLGFAVWSFCWGTRTAQRQERDPGRALAIVQGFRLGVIGLGLAGLGSAWLWHSPWLLGLSLIIGGEELLESSVIIVALKSGRQRDGAAPLPGRA